ncbi:MAG: acyltransferase, partial [Chitinophagaceae bacterium]
GVTIIDKCYINLSEEVTIGDNVALSYNVVILTHGAWQPVLYGFPAQFGPVRIGSGSVIYLNSVILPGVTLGEHVTIGAQSLVNRDVPAHHLAAGTPAKVVKNMESFTKPLPLPEIDRILTGVLSDYAGTLAPKEVELLELRAAGNPVLVKLKHGGTTRTIAYYKGAEAQADTVAADITLSFRPLGDAEKGTAHFNLQTMEIEGELDLVGEDLRDYIRRRAIRFLNGKPFKTIVIANVRRLRARRAGA